MENLRSLGAAPSVQMQPIQDDAIIIPDRSLIMDHSDPDKRNLEIINDSKVILIRYLVETEWGTN